MKTHHQTTWQFAKLILAALVLAFGAVTCSGGGGGGGGGSTASINPDGHQLEVTSVSIVAGTQQVNAGAQAARSDFVIAADANLRLSVTVRNSGNQPSPANTSFVLYRSDDGALGSGDTAVGTYAVGVVEAGNDKVISDDITTPTLSTDPARPTNFIVAGEFADDDVDDDFRGVEVYSTDGIAINNGAAIGGSKIVDDIEYDWSASGVAVSKASVLTGESVTFSVKVTNNGFRAPSASLRFYRSVDADISSGDDTPVGTVSVRALATGAISNESVSVTVPSAAGTYYYGACVAGAGDSDTSNDCSAGVQVVVTAPAVPAAYDLSVTAFSVSDSSIVAGDRITLTTVFTNASSATADAPEFWDVRYFRSDDATIDSSGDTSAGYSIVDVDLVPGESYIHYDSIKPPVGTYYYGACASECVDYCTAAVDSDTSNDCSAGVQVAVADLGFDLSVTAFSVSDSAVLAGDTVTFSATVGNDSSATASSSIATLRYYRSTDATITSADTEVGTADSISALAAAATESETAIVNPSTVGNYYYGACVVGTGDSDTSNDCSAAVRVVVAARDFDLSVTAFSVSDSSVVVGNRITFSATVGNSSSATESSPVATLKYYRSTNATIDATDTQVSVAFSIGALAAAATESGITFVYPRIAGTYYYGACVVGTGDSDTTNNCSAGAQVVVTASSP